ncbi:hypothetical protein [Nonlabens ulvanivorans]|uniref:hypothetical protein n=1 Tax=Nonlabens ulvanivorans TaxID=906888 RepID=UPI0037CB0438
MSVFVGLFNDVEISRRYITDVTNPLFFFCKILIFTEYWKNGDFKKYVGYYTKVGVWGSVILLPIAYFIYSSAGVNRIAIFPPLELPFASYLQGNPLILILILILILLYGKRAQLAGALMTFVAYIILFQKKKIFKYLMLGIIGIIVFTVILEQFSDNNAIRRLTYTYEQVTDAPSLLEGLSAVSAGRDDEIDSIFALMTDDVDYLFGLGVGFTYDLGVYVDKDVSNVHFSPLGFLSKYGMFFTLFIYYYLFNTLFSFNKRYVDRNYIVGYSLFIFIFIESFFSYSLFVTPLAAVSIGYLKFRTISSSINE